jgi:hypothetical protein
MRSTVAASPDLNPPNNSSSWFEEGSALILAAFKKHSLLLPFFQKKS